MERYKIIDKRPEAPPEMIEKTMDFDKLIAKKAASNNSSFKLMKSVAIAGVLVLLGYLSVVYLFIREDEGMETTNREVVSQEKSSPEIIHKSEETPDSLVEKEETTIEKHPEDILEKPAVSELTEVKEEKQEPVKQKEETTLSPKEVEKEPADYVYVEAEPMEGITTLYEYFDQTLKYPESAVVDSIQGVTVLTFTINVEGRPEQIIIEKSLGEAFDKEAIRLIEGMPLWRPATINGQNIKSKVSIPLTFRIE